MAGNIFSGHYGRRSSKPYLDQIPRILVAHALKPKADETFCRNFIPFDGSMHQGVVIRARVGALDQYLFICPECDGRCRILYLIGEAICRYCTEARYRSQSESSATRLQRHAYKVLKTIKLNPIDAQQKISGRHWTTHWRMLLAAEQAIEKIARRNEEIMSLLHLIDPPPKSATV